jgi:hypothetical protein
MYQLPSTEYAFRLIILLDKNIVKNECTIYIYIYILNTWYILYSTSSDLNNEKYFVIIIVLECIDTYNDIMILSLVIDHRYFYLIVISIKLLYAVLIFIDFV